MGQAVLVGSAPGRCGIVGNPTDMYGGSVISCSLGERAYVSVELADELSLESDQERVVVRYRADLQPVGDHCDILRAVIAHQRWYGLRASVRCWSDVPFASGLSSSTAMVAAALWTLAAYQDIHYEPHYFAEVARSIELNYLGVVCGYQDQYMATFGHLNYLDFRDKEFYRPRRHRAVCHGRAAGLERRGTPFHLGEYRHSALLPCSTQAHSGPLAGRGPGCCRGLSADCQAGARGQTRFPHARLGMAGTVDE